MPLCVVGASAAQRRESTGLRVRVPRVVLDNPDHKRSVFNHLRPNVPKWLPAWLDAHVMVIDLDD